MTDIFEVASWVSEQLENAGFSFAFIGGVALQEWGEPRVTRDVDLSVMIGFGDEPAQINRLLDLFHPRIEKAFDHAIANRVLLCKSEQGIGIDIGLAGFPFELEILDRQVRKEFLPGMFLPLVSAEDLIVMKAFAGRPQDWIDIRGILVRQADKLRWDIVENLLPELLDLIDQSDRMTRLLQLREESK